MKAPCQRPWTFILPALGLLLIGGLTYGFSLRLPFFFDDMILFRWLHGRTIGEILSFSQIPGYYRPLQFILWKLLWSLQGKLHLPTLHAINLGLHLFNGLLVWSVIKEWSPKRSILGVITALLFLVYPFSYQAVPFIGALNHPLVTAMILGALRLHQFGTRTSSRWPVGLSCGLAFLAPLVNEAGVLLPVLLSFGTLTGLRSPSLREMARRTGVCWLFALIGLGIWLAIPKEASRSLIWNLESRYQNAAYLLQGLTYPVAPMALKLMNAGWGLDDIQSVWLVSLLMALMWGVLLARAGAGRTVALALGWFLVTGAPIWLMLEFHYVIDGPRLLYLPSVGAALFWAAPFSIPWPSRRWKLLGYTLTALMVALTGLQSVFFIRDRARMYEQIRLTVSQWIHAVQSVPVSGPVLCINCPEWFAPKEPTFAIGHEGVSLGDFHYFDDIFWLITGEEREAKMAVLPDLQQEWRYNYASGGDGHTIDSIQSLLREVSGVVLADYEGEDIALYPAGRLEMWGAAPVSPFIADFAGQIRLLSAEIRPEGQTVLAILRWQCLQPPTEDVTVFLHMMAPSGQIIGQRDGYPLMVARPRDWQAGDIWRDVRLLRLPEGLPAGIYALIVGMYTREGGSRLPATDPAGHRFPDDAVPIGEMNFP